MENAKRRKTSDTSQQLNWLKECPSEIWEQVFSYLRDADMKTLLSCRATCSDFKYWVDKKTSFWNQIPLAIAVIDNRMDICQLIVKNAAEKNPPYDPHLRTPLHAAAYLGHFEIFNNIIDSTEDKNPATTRQVTPLHLAAERGHFEICRSIIEKVEDKNPANIDGHTPLHEAANQGHFEICRLLIDSVHNKNPRDHHGITPLHMAAKVGSLETCQLFIDNLQDISPVNDQGETPFDLARQCGGNERLCQFFEKALKLEILNQQQSIKKRFRSLNLQQLHYHHENTNCQNCT